MCDSFFFNVNSNVSIVTCQIAHSFHQKFMKYINNNIAVKSLVLVKKVKFTNSTSFQSFNRLPKFAELDH